MHIRQILYSIDEVVPVDLFLVLCQILLWCFLSKCVLIEAIHFLANPYYYVLPYLMIMMAKLKLLEREWRSNMQKGNKIAGIWEKLLFFNYVRIKYLTLATKSKLGEQGSGATT